MMITVLIIGKHVANFYMKNGTKRNDKEHRNSSNLKKKLNLYKNILEK